mmetsp:Transcript_50548/g.50918  ORF Transcript_50548/g.50918 Transcript_50548/m.50918 type:complete len:136 (-) Transcript_50548:101-508(-)
MIQWTQSSFKFVMIEGIPMLTLLLFIQTISPATKKKTHAFFKEHIHDAEEIRYVVDGSGYFDVRDKEDRWVRIPFKKGDLMTLPEGIYHRFTKDSIDTIHLMRLFIGSPIWTSFNRPCEEHPSRKKYVEQYLNKE